MIMYRYFLNAVFLGIWASLFVSMNIVCSVLENKQQGDTHRCKIKQQMQSVKLCCLKKYDFLKRQIIDKNSNSMQSLTFHEHKKTKHDLVAEKELLLVLRMWFVYDWQISQIETEDLGLGLNCSHL